MVFSKMVSAICKNTLSGLSQATKFKNVVLRLTDRLLVIDTFLIKSDRKIKLCEGIKQHAGRENIMEK